MGHHLWRALARPLAGLTLASVCFVAPLGSENASAAPTDACGTVLAKPAGGAWSCTFVDNFSTRYLDGTKWIAADTGSSGISMGGACFDRDANIAVGSGALRLKVSKTRRAFVCQSPTGSFVTQYTGASVTTATKWSQALGRFEARIKFPISTSSGLHGGFWMYPKQLTYGAWPASGEIDVAEWYGGASNYTFPSLHYTGRTQSDTGWWTCKPGDTWNYHTYAVEWYATSMTFFLDGVPCFTRAWDSSAYPSATAPFDQPFNMILTAALGSEKPADRDLPATTYVDYVKAWQ